MLIETDDSWGRRVVASVAAFARENRWRLLIAPRNHQRQLRLPRRWQGDGVIVSLRDRSTADHIRRSGLPAVDVSIMMPTANWLGRVATDDRARAAMALEHFRQRRLEHFACFAPTIGRYSVERANAFRDIVQRAGFTCDMFVEDSATRGWEIDHDQVVQWLSGLPRPLALFAADPHPARQIADVCDWNGVKVPDDVAILSGDNDDLLCSVSWPQLSSIQLACESIGAEASTLLRRLMNGGLVPKQPTLIPPLGVCARQSTDVMAIDDPEIVAVLRFMAEHIHQGTNVREILKQFPISRRSLEQRFRRLLNRSPGEQLRQLRMEHVRNLLVESDLTITEIAFRMDFASSSSLTQQFTRHFGLCPTAVRSGLRR